MHAGGANGRDHELQRRFHLGAIGFRRPEFRRAEHGAQHFTDVAIGLLESFSHAIDQRSRRIVGDKPNGQLARDKASGSGAARQNIEHLHALFFAVLLDLVAKHHFDAGFVHAIVEIKFPAALRVAHRPAGKDLGDFGHVALGVAAIDTEGVQFHQLAAVIFVQARFAPGLLLSVGSLLRRKRHAQPITAGTEQPALARSRLGLLGMRANALPVIEIKHHGRGLGGSHQQILEFAQRMRTNDVALVFGSEVTIRLLVDEDVEVVEPKIGHHLIELALAVGGTQYLGLLQLGDHHLDRVLQGLQHFALPGIHALQPRLALFRCKRAHDGAALLGRHAQNLLVALVRGFGLQAIEHWLRLGAGLPHLLAALAASIVIHHLRVGIGSSLRILGASFWIVSAVLLLSIRLLLGRLVLLLRLVALHHGFVDGTLFRITRR